MVAGSGAECGGFENTGCLLPVVSEIIGRKSNDVARAEHSRTPCFKGGGAPKQTLFVSLYAERIESQVSGETDGASAVEDGGQRAAVRG